jgi:hypothetical protein
MTPMAYVEEEITIQILPYSLLYTVPTAQDNPNTIIAAMDPTTAVEGTTSIVQEELPTMDCLVGPPFLNLDVDCDLSPPSPFSLKQLELIFEMKGYMMEQLHWYTLISKKIDMLFDALSNTRFKKRCMACTQPFALTPNDDTPQGDSLDGRFHCSNIPPNG